MAKDNDNPFASNADGASGRGRLKVIVRLALIPAVILIGVAGGYGLGSALAGGSPDDPEDALAEKLPVEPPEPDPTVKEGEYEYYDFEPIVVNLNEPRLARYIRATITLAIPKARAAAVTEQVSRKQKELRNWLTVYLSGRTLDDVRGPKHLNRIRREILDACNKQLWPNGKPMIEQVLFKEFAVQ